ncbi:MAG TPA: hypothetical protein VN213_21375, partial [Solirubrobacteraceae bacterium]|nr:hypothetical protein [Solirubrobacteraceae bacterium]
LVPLAPGERPRPLVVAAVLAAVVATADLVLLAAGWEIEGQDPSTAGVLARDALLLAAAVGIWQRRYWAVLGFQALLAIGATFAGLSLLLAGNVVAVVVCLVVMVGCGTLFWKLVRVMARIQVTSRREPERVG